MHAIAKFSFTICSNSRIHGKWFIRWNFAQITFLNDISYYNLLIYVFSLPIYRYINRIEYVRFDDLQRHICRLNPPHSNSSPIPRIKPGHEKRLQYKLWNEDRAENWCCKREKTPFLDICCSGTREAVSAQ